MPRIQSTLPILLAASVLLATPAAAGPFYLTGRLIDSSVDADLGDAAHRIDDGEETGWGAGVGLKLGRYLAVQAEYHDFGQVRGFGTTCSGPTIPCIVDPPFEADTTGVSLSVLPQVGVSKRLSIYGKIGVISWDSDITEVGPILRRRVRSFKEEELLLGAGLRFELPGPVDLFAEYEQAEATFETISFGVTLGY